jgi:hypothetical protein
VQLWKAVDWAQWLGTRQSRIDLPITNKLCKAECQAYWRDWVERVGETVSAQPSIGQDGCGGGAAGRRRVHNTESNNAAVA